MSARAGRRPDPARDAASATTRHRYQAVDSLRGVAAVTVALFHFNTAHGIISNLPVVRDGFLMVDFFFVLSGFVIATTYGQRLAEGFSIPAFLALRLARIYPLHLAVLLALLAVETVQALGHKPNAFTGIHSIGEFFACVFLIQPFVGATGLPWNGPSWSIAVEFWTYALFAVIWRWSGRGAVVVALLCAAGCGLWLWAWSRIGLNLSHAGALERCIFGFGIGVVVQRINGVVTRQLPPLGATALELGLGILAVVVVAGAGLRPVSFVLPPLFGALVLVFAREAGYVSRALRTPAMLRLGTLSYAIYMLHEPLWTSALRLLAWLDHKSGGRLLLIDRDNPLAIGGGMLRADLVILLLLAATLLLANVSWSWIERPSQLRLRAAVVRWLERHGSPKDVVLLRQAGRASRRPGA